MDGLPIGVKLHAKYSVDGKVCPSVVEQISIAPKRGVAPVTVIVEGYGDCDDDYDGEDADDDYVDDDYCDDGDGYDCDCDGGVVVLMRMMLMPMAMTMPMIIQIMIATVM